MQLIRLHAHTQAAHRLRLPPLALSIGNFDGVHLGHQTLLKQLFALADDRNLATAVMLFELQPKEFLLGKAAPPRVQSWQEKVQALAQLEVDYVFLVHFDSHFREQSALQFCGLLENLQTELLVIGEDFRFGHDRSGDAQLLMQQGFDVINIDSVTVCGDRASSTRIRECLLTGDFETSAQLLGRPYAITGRVQRGDQIGRTLDFPTANIALHRPKPCLHGIYAVDVTSACGTPLPELIAAQYQQQYGHAAANTFGVAGFSTNSLFGAASVGTRPAIEQHAPQWRLEVYLPTLQKHPFSVNLYGLKLKVTFLHLLHGERNYPSLDALKAGIADDVERLLSYRRAHQTLPFLPNNLWVD